VWSEIGGNAKVDDAKVDDAPDLDAKVEDQVDAMGPREARVGEGLRAKGTSVLSELS
jgi:hypothetical protein